jgi:hypothetical protein
MRLFLFIPHFFPKNLALQAHYVKNNSSRVVFSCVTDTGIKEMETGLPTATLLNYKKSHKHWTARPADNPDNKLTLPIADLKKFEGGDLCDFGPSEKRPKPEQKQVVVVKIDNTALGPKIVGWALAS